MMGAVGEGICRGRSAIIARRRPQSALSSMMWAVVHVQSSHPDPRSRAPRSPARRFNWVVAAIGVIAIARRNRCVVGSRGPQPERRRAVHGAGESPSRSLRCFPIPSAMTTRWPPTSGAEALDVTRFAGRFRARDAIADGSSATPGAVLLRLASAGIEPRWRAVRSSLAAVLIAYERQRGACCTQPPIRPYALAVLRQRGHRPY